MSPGELATLLALIRARAEEERRWTLAIALTLPRGHVRGRLFEVLDRAGFFVPSRAASLAAIDRAILEAEALEDMGAVEVLP